MDCEYMIQQGWQCPICKRVYSPHTSMCLYCGGDTKITSTNTKYGCTTDSYGESFTIGGLTIPIQKEEK